MPTLSRSGSHFGSGSPCFPSSSYCVPTPRRGFWLEWEGSQTIQNAYLLSVHILTLLPGAIWQDLMNTMNSAIWTDFTATKRLLGPKTGHPKISHSGTLVTLIKVIWQADSDKRALWHCIVSWNAGNESPRWKVPSLNLETPLIIRVKQLQRVCMNKACGLC